MRLHAVVGFLVLALAACAGALDTTIDVVYDPCQPIELIAATGTSAAQLDAIDAAAASWREASGASVARGQPGAPLPIRFEAAAAAFHGIYLDEEGAIVINRALDGDPGQAIAVAHELGHAFGLLHVDVATRPSVMNHGNLVVSPSPADARALATLWGRCPAR